MPGHAAPARACEPVSPEDGTAHLVERVCPTAWQRPAAARTHHSADATGALIL